ncbi:universal stress protein [Microbacterium sp.]|uniref:universal stress protein n=1 Tax=Microbacterium sp. TaxID=51671 RepID=UPI003A95C2EA
MSRMIVVGLTDAPVAERVLDWAAQRATDRRQQLRLVSVLGGAVGAVGEDALVSELLQAARARLEQAAARLRDQGLEVQLVVDRGDPTEKLVEAAAEAALLVIGSDYRGPGSGTVRGSHGIRIVSSTPCPVVVVPDFDTGGRAGVVVGIDGSPTSENALAWAAAEADRLREPLIAVSVWTPVAGPRDVGLYPEEHLTNLQQLTEEMVSVALAGLASQYPDLEVVRQVESGYPSSVINNAAAQARMAVVGSHGRGAFKRFLLGSISHEVLTRLATVTAIVR